jgi:hypothetical protein
MERDKMSSNKDFQDRISDVLTKYGCKPLPTAASDALAEAMERMVQNRTSCTMPRLGLATNAEILDELRARIEIHCAGGLDYRTVGGEEIANRGISTR